MLVISFKKNMLTRFHVVQVHTWLVGLLSDSPLHYLLINLHDWFRDAAVAFFSPFLLFLRSMVEGGLLLFFCSCAGFALGTKLSFVA